MKKAALIWFALLLAAPAFADPINPFEPDCVEPLPAKVVEAFRERGLLPTGHSTLSLERAAPTEFIATIQSDGKKSQVRIKTQGTGAGGPGYEHCPIEEVAPFGAN